MGPQALPMLLFFFLVFLLLLSLFISQPIIIKLCIQLSDNIIGNNIWWLALAWRSWMSSVQAQSDSSSVSTAQSSPVPGGLLYVCHWRRQHLRSASCRPLVVPRHRLSTFGRRAFAVAGPMSWNSLPNSLRESVCDDNISDDCFKHSLKTFLFSGYWRTQRSRGVHDSALYKCTFTYLLT